MNLTAILTGLAAVIAVVTGLGVLVGNLKANTNRATDAAKKEIIDTLDKELAVYKGRVETLENRDRECRQDLQQRAIEIGELQSEVAILHLAITAAPAIAELKTYIDDLHKVDKAYIDGRFDEIVGYVRGGNG